MCPITLDDADAFLSRKLDIVDGPTIQAGAVCVRFGKPVQEPSGDWSCRYSVSGLPDVQADVYRVFGIDAMQALFCALTVAEGLLQSSAVAQQGRLQWCGQVGSPYLR